MKKLFIILPLLISVVFAFGSASAEYTGSAVVGSLPNATEPVQTISQMIPFAETADDGGALGEKAKVKAMREDLNSNPLLLFVANNDEKLDEARLIIRTSLTAIREEDV